MAGKKRKYDIISTDGHTIEPPHMWETYLPKKFHPQMPRLVKDPEGGDAWEVVPGQPVMPIGLVTNEGEWGKRYEDNSWFGTTYESMRHGAYDGKARNVPEQATGLRVVHHDGQTFLVWTEHKAFRPPPESVVYVQKFSRRGNEVVKDPGAGWRGLARVPAITLKTLRHLQGWSFGTSPAASRASVPPSACAGCPRCAIASTATASGSPRRT